MTGAERASSHCLNDSAAVSRWIHGAPPVAACCGWCDAGCSCRPEVCGHLLAERPVPVSGVSGPASSDGVSSADEGVNDASWSKVQRSAELSEVVR